MTNKGMTIKKARTNKRNSKKSEQTAKLSIKTEWKKKNMTVNNYEEVQI